MKKLSVALAVYNEEDHIRTCLHSIQDIADEIVIVDGGSTDNTVEIARKYNAIIIQADNPKVFHINKKKAVEACSSEWVLQLDADEEVSPELAKEIKSVVSSATINDYPHSNTLFLRHQHIVETRDGIIRPLKGEIQGFYIARKNFFLGKPMTYAGMYPDGVLRLFKKDKATVPAKDVHEQIQVEGRVGWLIHDLYHYSNPTLKRYINGAKRYTTLQAKEISQDSHNGIVRLLLYMCIKPITTFFSLFFLHKGILDGIHGFLFSFFSALQIPVAYIKSITLKGQLISVLLVLIMICFPFSVHAEYVLPYPSVMPGNKLYSLTRLIDTIQGYWSWGSFAKIQHHLGLADKYLVEAKILFEYKQYLLGVDALKRSNVEVKQLFPYVVSAYSEHKDIKPTVQNIDNAMSVHLNVLQHMTNIVPEIFIWKPEHDNETQLLLQYLIDQSLKLRDYELLNIRAFQYCTEFVDKDQEKSIRAKTKECNELKKDYINQLIPNVQKLEIMNDANDSPFTDDEPYL